MEFLYFFGDGVEVFEVWGTVGGREVSQQPPGRGRGRIEELGFKLINGKL